METNLIVHNVLFMAGGIVDIILPVVVIYLRRKNLDALVVTFALMALSVAVFQISHVFGVNAASAEMSRQFLMWNLCMIPIQCFMTHWFLSLVGNTKKRRLPLMIVYFSGAILFIIYVIWPNTFLVSSVPKMYFPFYYEPGSLHWVMRVWFDVVGIYYFLELVNAYRKTEDPIKKNRYAYVLVSIIYGFIVGSTAILLVFDIEFDPMWSSFFGLYTVFIAYAVVKYELLNIRVIIERAFIYGLFVAISIGLISFSNYLSVFLESTVPGFPGWIVSVVISLIGVWFGFLIWKKLREGDLLKYEFVTIIAHKFRTPLTQTKWATEELLETEHDAKKRESLKNIEESNQKLVNLTGTLIELTNADKTAEKLYSFSKQSLRALVNSVGNASKGLFVAKKINFKIEMPADDILANIDRDRLKFVLQTLLENANNYTPETGSVTLRLYRVGNKVYVSVKDTGIGVAKKDLPMIFSKFFRTHKAQITDTEGFGIGLYLAKLIIGHHAGTIEAKSEGEGKGTEFLITLPVA